MKSLADFHVGGGMVGHATDLLGFALQLSESADPGDGQALRGKISELVASFEQRATQAGYSAGHVAQAKYAMLALLDEVVLTSNWGLKSAWLAQPLQMQHFGSFNAGEEFYARLDAIRQSNDPQKLDVAEIFYLSLALGFRGRYGGVQGLDMLRGLMNALMGELLAARKTLAFPPGSAALDRTKRKVEPQGLSPCWEPVDRGGDVVRKLPVVVVIAACTGVALLVFIALATLLGWQVDAALAPLQQKN
ncbi:MAG: type IVB secretion system protein IcmH/DotU [Planctomycetes bacterium]|nr:type IVB secretion system protein IcmH/DotU [Planctomycetota bacterium]